MKVIAKLTVLDRIRDDIRALKRAQREADCIVVTHEEYHDLSCDMRRHFHYEPLLGSAKWRSAATPVDEVMKTREFALRPNLSTDPYRPPRLVTYQHGLFMGVPLFVVPVEYHPL